MTAPLRVLIADDHPLFLSGLRLLVEQSSELELVGIATTGVQAVELAAELRPDVIVMDLQLPELSGIEATRQIISAQPDSRVLALTMFEHDDYLFSAIRAGARGYILKGAVAAEITQAILSVGAGHATFGEAVASRILTYITGGTQHPARTQFPELTEREHEVLALLAHDLGNAAIARRLGIEPKTVRNYVAAILVKLHAGDRSAAAERARDAGLG